MSESQVDNAVGRLARSLMFTDPINIGEWQGLDVSKSRAHRTWELLDVRERFVVPDDQGLWNKWVQPTQPWADEHFAERVSGEPYNPPPSAKNWPHAVRGNGDHTTDAGQFSHTYPERFWPKFANEGTTRPNGRQVFVPHNGIRFEYGDLRDVADLLTRSPLTRQAYLPVWFPEDTGTVHRQRVPCTLGYHFMIRDHVLSCRYYLRSCDLVRHFRNDIYFAGRLMQWMADVVTSGLYYVDRDTDGSPVDPPGFRAITTGDLIVSISSLHAFVADEVTVKDMAGWGRPKSKVGWGQ